MKRRAFLGALAALGAGLVLDPERLLWSPGAKTIFLPPAKPSLVSSVALTRGDIFTIEGVYAVHPLSWRELDILQNFVITADIASGELSPKDMAPNMIFDGCYTNVHGVLTPNQRVMPLLCGKTIADAAWEAFA